jgi:hypothetical protein
MAKSKLRFTERDVSRVIRATEKAGLQVGRVVVETTGDIVVVAAQLDEPRTDEPTDDR